MRRTLVLSLAALTVLPLWACPDSRTDRSAKRRGAARRPIPSGPRVIRIKVRDRTSPEERIVRLSRDDIRREASTLIQNQGIFSMDEGGPAIGPNAWVARIDVEVQSLSGSEKGKLSVLLGMELRRLHAPPDESQLRANTVQERVYRINEVQNLRKLLLKLLRAAVAESLHAIGAESRLRTAPARVVVHAIKTSRIDVLDQGWAGQPGIWLPLSAPGSLTLLGNMALPGLLTSAALADLSPGTRSTSGLDLRELAIKLAALRRLKAAVPAIVSVLVRDPRGRIQDLCLGALAEIGDRTAVPALTRYARFGDVDRLRKTIGVLGQIGGEEAAAFLELTADGHDDEDIQKLARDTLDGLRRRQGASSPK